MSAGVLAAFGSEQAFHAAVSSLRAAKLGEIETYTPKPPEEGHSVLPLLVMLAGVLGAVASFALQTYANVFAYPINIGGRPGLSWPAFVPIAFENGVLAAVATGFVGYLVANRLPWLYDKVDECAAMRRAMRDLWCVAIRTDRPERARAVLHKFAPASIEDLPP
ncbi:MAG: DUF3341 domain-containing protein [Acetobacteraceae bacterium]|nr:DUF3341 domain-containing protein [Acetobacteraceae bacterium]